MADKQFANVPDHLQGKMERCVKRVKATGKSKSSAIAICFESVVRGKDLGELIDMSTKQKAKRRKRRRAARALARAKEKQAAGESLSHEEQTALAKASFKSDSNISKEDAAAEVVAAISGETAKIEITEDIGDLLEFERDPKSDPEEKSHTVAVEVLSPDLPVGGATTFDELDDYREARMEANDIRGVIWDFEMLVDNVLAKSDPGELGDKIVALGAAMKERLENPSEEKGIIDSLKDRLIAPLQKAKLTRASINNLPDSAFAFIEAGGKKDKDGKTTPRSLRHFPIHDAAHIRNALARAAQGIKKGGDAAKNARRALPKIKAAAKKLGIGQGKKSSGFQVFKSKDGFRWFGWVSNKFRDRDWPAEPKLGGQIITEQAHKEFVTWVDEDPKENMPRLWPWHTLAGEHKDRADWIDYTDGFLVMSGPLTEKEGELLTELGKEYDLAMSHGLVRSDDHYDKERGLIQRYRTFEASYLPRKFAANEWTDIISIAKEVAEMGFTPEKRTFLERVLGEEKVMELEQNTEDRAKELDALGVEYKGLEEALALIDSSSAEETEEKEKTPEKEVVPAKEFEGLSTYLEKQAEATEANSKAIVEIGNVLVRLSKSDDEKVAEAIRPKISMKDTKPIWQRSASESKENVIEVDDDGDPKDEEDKDLLKSKPGNETHWMEEVLGAGAVEVAPVPK